MRANKSINNDLWEVKEKEKSRRSRRAKISKTFGSNFITYLLENEPQIYFFFKKKSNVNSISIIMEKGHQ
jgi:hypothetical protein